MFGDLRLDPQTQQRKAPHQRFTEMLEQVKLADEVGLDVFEMGEHHRADYSVTNPQLFLSAAAAVTKKYKIRIGSNGFKFERSGAFVRRFQYVGSNI